MYLVSDVPLFHKYNIPTRIPFLVNSVNQSACSVQRGFRQVRYQGGTAEHRDNEARNMLISKAFFISAFLEQAAQTPPNPEQQHLQTHKFCNNR